MCSQRMRAAMRIAILLRSGRDFLAVTEALLDRRLSPIGDRGGFDLNIPLEVLGERLAGDRDRRLDDLISAVLAGCLDHQSVVPRVDELTLVVLAIPDGRVLARLARGFRNRVNQVA